MIASIHPSTADLIWYAVTADKSDKRVAAVREHLHSGCDRCVLVVQRFRETSTEQPFHEDMSVLEPGWIVPRRIVVVQDAQRAGAAPDVHLIVGAGPYELDILMRERKRSAELEMAGQVTRAGRIYEPVVNLSLELVESRAARIVTDTQTDKFGEFDLVSSTDGCFGVRLGKDENAPCVLVWEGSQA